METARDITRAKDPETSKMAADRITRSGTRDSQNELVLKALKSFVRSRGFYPTSAELAWASNLDHQVTWKRLPDLRKLKLVENDVVMGTKFKRLCKIKKTLATTWKPTS